MPTGSREGETLQALRGIPAPGEIVAGKFILEQILGVGGMGVVLAAHHQHLQAKVAIKFLLPETARDAEAATRFLREARAAVQIRSEHVVRVIDVGTTDSGIPYVVMEHLTGQDLAELLEADGPLPVTQAVNYVLQACHAVAQAHALGIVHRDLKPANLFVARHSDDLPVIKVLDFGVSKTTRLADEDASLTKSSSLVGSPLYMAPEQIRSPKAVDARADVWALGVILYQLLTGRCPFEAETVLAVGAKILSESPTRLSEHRPDTPADLEQIVLRCLVKEPEARVQSVADLAQALAPFASDEAKLLAARIVRARASSVTADAEREAPTSTKDRSTVGKEAITGSEKTLAVSLSSADTVGSGARRLSLGGTSPALAPTVASASAAIPEEALPRGRPRILWGAGLTVLVVGAITAVVLVTRNDAPPPSTALPSGRAPTPAPAAPPPGAAPPATPLPAVTPPRPVAAAAPATAPDAAVTDASMAVSDTVAGKQRGPAPTRRRRWKRPSRRREVVAPPTGTTARPAPSGPEPPAAQPPRPGAKTPPPPRPKAKTPPPPRPKAKTPPPPRPKAKTPAATPVRRGAKPPPPPDPLGDRR